MAASAPMRVRYGRRWRWATAVVVSVMVSPVVVGRSRSPASRCRSARAKPGAGGTRSSVPRSASRGSAGISAPLEVGIAVGATEGEAGPHEQRLGGVHRAAQQLGHLGDGQPVEVAQRQGGAVVGAEGG